MLNKLPDLPPLIELQHVGLTERSDAQGKSGSEMKRERNLRSAVEGHAHVYDKLSKQYEQHCKEYEGYERHKGKRSLDTLNQMRKSLEGALKAYQDIVWSRQFVQSHLEPVDYSTARAVPSSQVRVLDFSDGLKQLATALEAIDKLIEQHSQTSSRSVRLRVTHGLMKLRSMFRSSGRPDGSSQSSSHDRKRNTLKKRSPKEEQREGARAVPDFQPHLMVRSAKDEVATATSRASFEKHVDKMLANADPIERSHKDAHEAEQSFAPLPPPPRRLPAQPMGQLDTAVEPVKVGLPTSQIPISSEPRSSRTSIGASSSEERETMKEARRKWSVISDESDRSHSQNPFGRDGNNDSGQQSSVGWSDWLDRSGRPDSREEVRYESNVARENFAPPTVLTQSSLPQPNVNGSFDVSAFRRSPDNFAPPLVTSRSGVSKNGRTGGRR